MEYSSSFFLFGLASPAQEMENSITWKILLWSALVGFFLAVYLWHPFLKSRIFGRKIPRVILEYEEEKKRKLLYQRKKIQDLVGSFDPNSYSNETALAHLKYDPTSTFNNCFKVFSKLHFLSLVF